MQQYYIIYSTLLHKVILPTAPSSLPQYLVDGLPKQDDEALQDAHEYINELLTALEQRRQEPVTEDDLPEADRSRTSLEALYDGLGGLSTLAAGEGGRD